jgi:hypothetical protein
MLNFQNIVTQLLPGSTNQADHLRQQDPGIVLLLQVPRTNDKKELAAEQLFASLHGLLTKPSPKQRILMPDQPVRERISFEIAVRNKRIGFYVWLPTYLKNYVEEQIYAQYPTVQIDEVPDYSMALPEYTSALVGTELTLTTHDALPIKTFQSFEVDPLASITATLAKFSENEEAWIQLVIQPAKPNWHKRNQRYTNNIRSSTSRSTSNYLSMLWEAPTASTESTKLSDDETLRANAASSKSEKLAFNCMVRILYRGQLSQEDALMRLRSITSSYKQFNTTYLNGFESKRFHHTTDILERYQVRSLHGSYVCNIEEVATLYHLPHTNVETPYILWALSQTAEPPATIPLVSEAPPEMISPIAITNFRGHNMAYGMPRSDRGRHLYIIGQTGVGKSGLLELLTIADVNNKVGFAVIDPHGDYAQSILRRIPADRVNDVIYFNPADTEFPIPFNPMELTDPKLKSHTVSELIGVLKRMFDSWGPRLEYILRYTLLALLDYPNTTMLDITRMLTDKGFRKEVLNYVTDPVIKNFWEIEFASLNDIFAAEAVAPVLNKVGAFTANPLVRNIIGQPKASFNIRQIMDERKILIVNLSRGLIGEDNASLLGALLVTKIQLAAMSRADIDVSERHPFYLYVDEFQNFATDSFATILSEARKYGLTLTVANQYIAQMPMEVRDAVFGNVGSVIAFRMGAYDGSKMQKYFEPKFTDHDLVHMHNRHFIMSMTIDGEKAQAFSSISMDLPDYGTDYSSHIIERNRQYYAVDRQRVHDYIAERYMNDVKTPAKRVSTTAPTKPAHAQPATQPSTVTKTTDLPAQKSVQPQPHPTAQVPASPKRKRNRKRKAASASAPVQRTGDFGGDGVHLRLAEDGLEHSISLS